LDEWWLPTNKGAGQEHADRNPNQPQRPPIENLLGRVPGQKVQSEALDVETQQRRVEDEVSEPIENTAPQPTAQAANEDHPAQSAAQALPRQRESRSKGDDAQD